MPKHTTTRGMPSPRVITQIGEELHIDGRVYRVSDLSEIVGRQAIPLLSYAYPGNSNSSWNIRAKRGYLPNTRSVGAGTAMFYPMSDFDIALCGVWKNATIAGFNQDDATFRNSCHGASSRLLSDYNKTSGKLVNGIASNALFAAQTSIDDAYVALSKKQGGHLLMTSYGNPGTIAGSLEALPSTTPINGSASLLTGVRSGATVATLPRRIFENDLRSFFLSNQVSATANSAFSLHRVANDTLGITAITTSGGLPAGAAAVGTGSGYTNSAPSYAIETDVDEISSYLAYRTATAIEIHRVQLSAIAGATTFSNNLVALDSNPMVTHAAGAHNTGIRCVVAKLPNGDKFLLVLSIDNYGTPTPATSKLYCFKIVSKNSLQYISTTQLAVGPRNYLAANDDWTRFIVAYDDRYEMWTLGDAGAITLAETVFVTRNNTTHYNAADAYGFDSVGRFWYITPESVNPVVYSELGLNFISPPGAVNTIKLEFDQDGYEYTGTAVPGNVSVSVTDINGNYLAVDVRLSGTSNVTFGNSVVTTSATGPITVPFSVTAPGEVSVSGETV